jgi:glycosyltransferase involved in cell wall biosynthesis
MGVDVTILNLDQNQQALGSVPELRMLSVREFPTSESLTAHLMNEQHRYDAVLATLYRSVYWLPREATCRVGYYVQDFEPYFFADTDAEYAAAMRSYRVSHHIRLLTKTKWTQNELWRHSGRSATLLGPSVEVAAFAPGPSRKQSEPIHIVAMVRLSTPRRAPRRTLAVLERAKKVLGDRVSVTIFGSDDGELHASGLGRRWVMNAGRLDQSALAALLSRADIFLDCSDFQAMGLTALEAMLSGCAVIAPQRGGTNDFIRNGMNGILVDTKDEEACVEALVELVKDEALLQNIRMQAIQDANLYFPENAALRLMTAMFDDA